MYEDHYKDDLYYQFPTIDDYRDKVISRKDVMTNPRLLSDIRTQVQHEWMRSKSFVQNKRTLFKTREQKIRDPGTALTDRIKINMLHQHRKAFISTFMTSDLGVSITGREFSDDDYAYALEKCAEYDYEAMKFSRKKFMFLSHIATYGVALRIKNGRDKVKQCVDYTVVNPKYRYPDPQGNIFDGFRYHGFDASMSKNEMLSFNSRMREEIYFNLDKVDISINVEYEAGRASDDTANRTSSAMERRGRCSVFHRYTEIAGRKYATTRSSVFNNLIRFEPIEPVDKLERANPSIIPYPINVGCVFPIEGDPFGMGLTELLLDFQNAKNRLMNLALIKEERNAGFKQFLVDISKVNNLNVFERRNQDGPTFIPVRGGNQGIGQPVVPVGDDAVDGNTFNMADKLDSEAQMQTGFNNQIRGGMATRQQTLGQDQIQQQNANAMFELDAEVLSRSEEDFAKNFRFRSLKEYMTSYDKKSAKIMNGLASTTYEIRRTDLLSCQDPDVKVESKKLRIDRDKKRLDYLLAREQIVMMNPRMPQISKIMYVREMDKLAGLPREEVLRNNPLQPDERRALLYYNMINEGIKPKNLFMPGMDYFTYYIYISNCKDSDTKREIVNILEKKIIEEGQAKELEASQSAMGPQPGQAPQPGGQPGGQMAGVANSMASQSLGKFLGGQGQAPQQGKTTLMQ